MSLGNQLREWARPAYYLGQNTLSLIGAVLTTSSAITLIGFWIYDFILPGPPHPLRRHPDFPDSSREFFYWGCC